MARSRQSSSRAEVGLARLVEEVPRARADELVGDAVARLRQTGAPSAAAVYVTDPDGRLLGSVALGVLLAAPSAAPLGDCLAAGEPTAHPGEDQERVAHRAIRHGVTEMPVVDGAGRLLGAVPARALLAVLYEEHAEDLHRLAGIRREQQRARAAIEEPPVRQARDRLPWLLVGLAGSALATYVMARFESALEARVALAFFVPGIVYLADAVGTQTEAIVVRGLSLGRVPIRRLFAHEVRGGALIGAVFAALVLPAVWLAFGDSRLAWVVATALFAASVAASGLGLLLPWALSRLGTDPAFGSGPLATIVQDVLSLLIYFGLAHAWLGSP